MRSAWTRYILSLMFRRPTTVSTHKSHSAEMWEEGVKALELDYDLAAAQIGAANLLMLIIDNDRLGPTIFKMHWSCIPLSKANVELLCSDRPIDRPMGLDDPRAYIALPVAPRLLFLAAHDDQLARDITERNHTETVR